MKILSYLCDYDFFKFFVILSLLIDWNKDFKPGPLPTNEEERRAAAKKYGLLPEEYETYPNDGETCTHKILK